MPTVQSAHWKRIETLRTAGTLEPLGTVEAVRRLEVPRIHALLS